MSNPALNICDVFGLLFDQDGVEAFAEAGHASGAAASKEVQYDAARRGDEAAEVGDQVLDAIAETVWESNGKGRQ